jgi:hypothetical protein
MGLGRGDVADRNSTHIADNRRLSGEQIRQRQTTTGFMDIWILPYLKGSN